LNKKYQIAKSQKILFIAFILFILVITIITSTSNLLKAEVEDTHESIARVYNNNFSEHFNDTIYNMELFVKGIEILYLKSSDEKTINEYLLKYLGENPYIRSINIIEKKQIIKSTNNKNIGLEIDTSNYYPKPLFDDNILRFGDSSHGRDFNESKQIDSKNKYETTKSIFLPISKIMKVKEQEYTVLIALNIEEFANKYTQTLDRKIAFVDISNLEGKVLISSDLIVNVSDVIFDNEILNILKQKGNYSGIKNINKKEIDIVSISLIKKYPIVISVRLDYKKTLQLWEEKRFNFLFIITILLVFIIILILLFIKKNEKNKQKEIEIHKSQIESQKRFKILFEQTPFFSFILDENGKINKINILALSFLGNTKDFYINTYIWDLYCFNSECKFWLENAIKNNSAIDNIEKELIITNFNSEKKYIDITINSIVIDGKKELVFFAKDISEKKENERELRQAYQVFKNTHDGIMITNNKNEIINVNDAFINCTGYQLKEVLNKNPNILRSEKNAENFYENMWIELSKNNYWDGEITNKRKDGTDYVEKLTISAVYNKKNKLTNYIGVFSDISKQKQQEEIIKEKERMLFQQSKMASMGEMLGNIAHQWRQPLSVISIAAGAIKLGHEYEGTYGEKEIIDFIDSITNSTQYLSETIDDFRNFFTQDIKDQNFDCLDTINMTLKLLSSNFKYKEIDIIFKRHESDNIFASQNEFKQVMMNILNNAKDALLDDTLNEKKYIFIDVYTDDNYIYIDILDNAGGISENIKDKIFEPYFTTKHKSIGTGIGLYMVEEILTKHMYGEINVSNEDFTYDNMCYKGAKFSIKLPISKNK
jgi:PAS domain S-box-containing protein